MVTIRSALKSDEMAEARPFYLITTFAILTTSVLTLFTFPDPMPVSRLPLFLVLLAVHIALHWFSGNVVAQTRWRIPYMVGQAILALTLAMVSNQPELILTMFAALTAATLGLLGLTRLASAGVAGYLFLTGASFYLLGGLPMLLDWLPPTASTMTLLILFMILYRRQLDANQRSQYLLTELETAHFQLADYAAQVEGLTLAAERQRMARELHDTLAQGVAGLVMQLEAANNHLENGRIPRAKSIVEQSMKRARHTLAEARAAIDDLRLESRALPEAIQYHVNRFTQATGISCQLKLDLDPEKTLSPAIADHVERMIGESLANITRHARADNVWLSVTQSAGLLNVEVRDDGVGFDVDTAIRAGHYGLLGMRERARFLGGTVEIKSQAQQGTVLQVRLPLEGK